VPEDKGSRLLQKPGSCNKLKWNLKISAHRVIPVSKEKGITTGWQLKTRYQVIVTIYTGTVINRVKETALRAS
jgi:hypothetical protein